MAKIGDIVKRLGIPATTLRYYDREGLLPELDRTQGGLRSFDNAAIAYIFLVHTLRQSGVSIRELKNLMEMNAKGDSGLAERDEFIKAKLAAVASQIEVLERARLMLEYEHWRDRTAMEHGGMEYVNNLSEAEVPEKYRGISAMTRAE